MRRIPGFAAGTGTEDVMFPMKVMVCSECGHVFDEDIKTYKLEELYGEQSKDEKSEAKIKKDNTTLIL